ncbi:MAG: tRNA (guanosine(37)-N1)-methyltransferase TrmD [bacterium]|nr:tRNA (guanosine(37)-N1)-methyltransferase TrmD [bacterium]
MYVIDIVTIFPEIVAPYLNASIMARAQDKRRVRFGIHDLRQWAEGKHRQVDDAPFGGGPGMVMMVEPFARALRALKAPSRTLRVASAKRNKTRVVLTSAKGALFTQRDAERYATHYNRLVILCGRYEGVDERVAMHLADEEVSVGPYVLTGGELPALTIADAVTRLIPGVLGDPASLADESYQLQSNRKSKIENLQFLEYPQYTRPADFSPKRGVHWCVPDILLTGDHAAIAAWREAHRASRDA